MSFRITFSWLPRKSKATQAALSARAAGEHCQDHAQVRAYRRNSARRKAVPRSCSLPMAGDLGEPGYWRLLSAQAGKQESGTANLVTKTTIASTVPPALSKSLKTRTMTRPSLPLSRMKQYLWTESDASRSLCTVLRPGAIYSPRARSLPSPSMPELFEELTIVRSLGVLLLH